PCGAAVAEDIAGAYRRAFECDPMSAFGGIVALNRPVGEELAAEIVANPMADVMVAPGYTSAALELFVAKRKNMRVLEAPPPGPTGARRPATPSSHFAMDWTPWRPQVSPLSSSPGGPCATTTSSPPPTSTGWPWS